MKDFEYIRLKAGQTVEIGPDFKEQLIPRKIYHLPTGAIGDKPSYLCTMHDIMGNEYITQISHEMLFNTIAESMTPPIVVMGL